MVLVIDLAQCLHICCKGSWDGLRNELNGPVTRGTNVGSATLRVFEALYKNWLLLLYFYLQKVFLTFVLSPCLSRPRSSSLFTRFARVSFLDMQGYWIRCTISTSQRWGSGGPVSASWLGRGELGQRGTCTCNNIIISESYIAHKSTNKVLKALSIYIFSER